MLERGLIQYLGGPLDGGCAPFPSVALEAGGYEEHRRTSGSDRLVRYVLGRLEDGRWSLLYAGSVAGTAPR